jgi:transcriptional regulator with XRE-family HTH domain
MKTKHRGKAGKAGVASNGTPTLKQLFGQTLGRYRRRRRLSQEELARRAELSMDSLRRWERGLCLPRVDAAARLAAALGTTVYRLMGRRNP